MCFWATPLVRKGGKYDLETRKIFVSRDVVFFEDKFPFHLEPKLLGSETVNPNDFGLLFGMADGPVLYPDKDTHSSRPGGRRRTASNSPKTLAHKYSLSKEAVEPSGELG